MHNSFRFRSRFREFWARLQYGTRASNLSLSLFAHTIPLSPSFILKSSKVISLDISKDV
jgi:hypothetical protein